MFRDRECLQYGNSPMLLICTWTGTVCSTVTAQRYMFVQGQKLSAVRYQHNFTCLYRDRNCLHYGNSTTLHVCTGTGNVCSTVTAQCCIFVQGQGMSAIRYKHNVTYLYSDRECLQYGNSTMLHICTGTGAVCFTVTAQRYMFLQGLELCALR